MQYGISPLEGGLSLNMQTFTYTRVWCAVIPVQLIKAYELLK